MALHITSIGNGSHVRLSYYVEEPLEAWQWANGAYKTFGGVAPGARALQYSTDGTLQVFQRASGGALHHWYYQNGWNSHSLGNVIAGPPVAVQFGPQLHVFGRSPSNTLSHNYFSGGWYNADHGGSIIGAPATATYRDGSLQVFARGADSKLHHWYYLNGWNHETFAEGIAGDPAVIQYGGQLHIFARTLNNHLWHRWFDGYDWHVADLGGSLATDPTATLFNGQLDVFVGGNDYLLKHYYTLDGNSFYSQTLSGGSVSGKPTSTTYTVDGSLQVYARGTDNKLQHWFYLNNGWAYEPLGDVIATDPTVMQYNNQIDIFAGSTSGTLFHRFFTNSWGTESLGGSVAAE